MDFDMPPISREAAWFQGSRTPPDAKLAGLSALVETFRVTAPVRRPSVVSNQHVYRSTRDQDGWRVFDKRYDPGDTVGGNLEFALRHDDFDALVLKRIFEALPADVIAEYVRSKPSGMGPRRVWYLYEQLLGVRLNVPDGPLVKAVDLLDTKRYFTVPGTYSGRHRVNDNRLGNEQFSPVIRRTPVLEAYAARDLARLARETVGRVSQQMVGRAASFLLLADSQASFAIENERPPRNRLESWGRAVLEAGRRPLSLTELERLHGILIGDNRFVAIGLRQDGVFLGERDREGNPIPEFVGARPQDLLTLLQGMFAANERMTTGEIDPVLQSAAIAFGFVYIHPLEDGNGRIHRCLIHQVLAERDFSPPGVVFPVSSVMADRLESYQATLRNHSAPLMPYIEWQPTAKRNVEVLNDTADLYRYFDCTEAAEFLYSCVERTVTEDLPEELEYLRCHDVAMREVMDLVALPDRLAADFIMFVRQNNGTLSKRRRESEYAKLTDAEVSMLEQTVNNAFNGNGEPRD